MVSRPVGCSAMLCGPPGTIQKLQVLEEGRAVIGPAEPAEPVDGFLCPGLPADPFGLQPIPALRRRSRVLAPAAAWLRRRTTP